MPAPFRSLIAAAGLGAAGTLAFFGLRDGVLAPEPARPDSSTVLNRADGRPTAPGVLAPSTATAPVPVAAPPSNLTVRGVAIPYRPFAVFVQPGEVVPLHSSDGTTTWTAPASPGPVPLGTTGLTAVVRKPFDNAADTVLNGYTIGRYGPARHGDDSSSPPAGLVLVTRELAALPVSPSFRLGDFLCHQQPNRWPQYVLLDERLLVKLERLVVAAKARGYGPIRVLSGYRTPWYNRSIGNETTYSHHLFGRAADVYIDGNNDGTMDDLDGDGQVTEADTQRLEALVLALDGATPGGTGLYAPAAHRGPFVHMDVSGRASRWTQ
ncbi:MAG: DUF882 domain-containing protein [Rhodothermales bacterium]|nr:DUF882 domain-containing protein [Rhodothermales bacterium]